MAGELVASLSIGQDLVVRDQHDDLDAEVLESDPVRECAEVMTDVEWTGRTVAGQDPERAGVAADLALESGAALERCLL